MTHHKKQIAKNALYLYLRKGFSILIGLYSSRLLLDRLGVDDFGLYGVVGSVVILFNALRYIFNDSVQRYINIAKGKGDAKRISEIFSVGINVHILLSIVLIIVVEIGGYFILPHLNTGNNPWWEIQILFQLSLLTAVVTLLTVPFDALIIANEKFNAYAILSIIDIILRLLAVVVLICFPHWRVIWYAAITLFVSIMVRYINAIYCKKAFKEEAVYNPKTDRTLLKEMTKFAGWNFVGNLGYWSTFSGTDLLLNHFGGLAINAARSITNQVFSNFQQFVGDLNTSFRPKSMILFSEGLSHEYYSLLYLNSKVNFIICSVLAFSFSIFANEILKIWLSEVPPMTAIFCQLILVYSVIRSLRGPIDIFFKANGDLRLYQTCECLITLLNLPISWFALYTGAPLYSVFIIMAGLEVINFVTMVCIAKKKFNFNSSGYFEQVGKKLLSIIPVICIIYIAIINFTAIFSNSYVSKFIFLLSSIVVLSFMEFYVMFSYSERKKILSLFVKKH